MKRVFILQCLLLLVCAVYCTAYIKQLNFDRTCPATVAPVNGFYIFINSRPAVAFDSLGAFKVPQQFTGEPREQMRTAFKLAADKYPTATGLIFTGDNMQHAVAVRLLQ